MKINLKQTVAILFVATQCFAGMSSHPHDDRYVSPGARLIQKYDDERRDAYRACWDSRKDEILPLTQKINGALKKPTNVEKRTATKDEKEIILRAVMRTVMLHGHNETQRSIFDKRKELREDWRYWHFEILRLTEMLAGDFLNALKSDGSSDVGIFFNEKNKFKYKDLTEHSGLSFGCFVDYFIHSEPYEDIADQAEEEIEKIKAQQTKGLFKKPEASVPSVDFETRQTLKTQNVKIGVVFGNIPNNKMMGEGCSVAFINCYIGQYYGTEVTCGVRARLPNKNGRERYVVIQGDTTWFENDSHLPYMVSAHAIINGDATDRNVDVRIRVVNGDNWGRGASMDETGSVNSHPDGKGKTAYSPNNMHITGLSKGDLKDSTPIYSLVSRIDGDGRAIDTLHIMATGTLTRNFYYKANESRSWGEFLDKLVEMTRTDTPLFCHIKKLLDFSRGSIPTTALN